MAYKFYGNENATGVVAPENEYSVTTENTSLDINVTKLHEDQTIEIIGNQEFVLGENSEIFTILKSGNKA